MYRFSKNSMEICGCGIPWIIIIVNSFTCYLFETTSTNDRLTHLKTKHRQPSLCLPNRLWSILHIVLHWSMALVWSKKPLQHQGCEYVYSCFLWDFKVILQFSLRNGSVYARWIPKSTDVHVSWGFPGGASSKEPTCQCRRHKRYRFPPWVGKISWRRAWQPTPVSLLENPMDRGAWRTTVCGVARVRHDWATRHTQSNLGFRKYMWKAIWSTGQQGLR